MAAIKPAQTASFLKSPPADIQAILFYGSDPGLVSERGQVLAKTLAGRQSPPGEVMRLDDTDLDTDPTRLDVELSTQPMFSGRKIIRAIAGRRISTNLIKPILTAGLLEGILIVEAGNLKADDGLRSLFEKHSSAAAIPCYPDSAADIDALITDVLKSFRMTIEPDARDLLGQRLGADRSLSRAEVEKLALYAMPRTSITADDIDAIVGDASDLALERIAEAAASGRATIAVNDYGRALAAGENAQVMILITQRYFLKLHRLLGAVEAGQSIDEAVRGLRPPVHFKQRDALMAQARLWSLAALEAALHRIAETARAARRTSTLDETLGERLILALAAMATSATASRRR